MNRHAFSTLRAAHRTALPALALLLVATLVHAQSLSQNPVSQSPAIEGSVLIQNATVLTVTNGTIENGDVLVIDGVIRDIGLNLTPPAGVPVVDATGKHLMPGIIDAHSHAGITAVNEATSPVTAEVQIEDVVNPMDVTLYRALAGGVTTIHAMHGSANAIGGQCETLKLRWGAVDPEEIKMEGAPRTIKFALGENPTRVHGRGNGIRPSTRMGVEQVIRQAFTEAQRYRMEQDLYEAERRTNPTAVPPDYNERHEALADVLAGEVLIHAHSYRADEILMLAEVLEDFGVERMTFQHANEAYKVAPELAVAGAGASVFSDWWAYKFEVYYSTAFNATILTRNGVRTSINSDSGELIRHLYHEAAKMQRYGDLSDDEALALITINPAWQLGIDDRVGSIEIGKDGDLALFDGHPLSIYAVPTHTFVDGVLEFDRTNDPDDIRLYIDPDADIEEAYVHVEQAERCLDDAHLSAGAHRHLLGGFHQH